MVEAVHLAADQRQQIADRLAHRLAGSALLTGPAEGLELGEAFEVCLLRSSMLGRGRPRRLKSIVKRAPYLHLQVRRSGSAILAAHADLGLGEWSIGNLFGTSLAPKIQSAIAFIDEQFPDEGNARLLLVPECSVCAFWIEQRTRDRLVLVSSGKDRGLAVDESYSVNAFLRALFGERVVGPITPAKVPRRPPRRTRARRR